MASRASNLKPRETVATTDTEEQCYDPSVAEYLPEPDVATLPQPPWPYNKWVFIVVIILLGGAASAAFLSLGIVGTRKEKADQFDHEAEHLSHGIQTACREYEMFALWIHQGCHRSFERQTNFSVEQDIERYLGMCSRNEFRSLYEHIASLGLDFQSAQFVPLVNHTERYELERQSSLYYAQNYPDLAYEGITGVTYNSSGERIIQSRPEQPFYWPIHYLEPILTNEAALELDIYSKEVFQRDRIEKLIATYKPVLSSRLTLVQEKHQGAYGLILQHPGLSTSVMSNAEPVSIAQIVIRVPDLLARAASGAVVNKSVYLFDSTESTTDPEFLGAVHIMVVNGATVLTRLPETTLHGSSSRGSHSNVQVMSVADRLWTVSVISDGDKGANIVYVILGGTMIFLACILLAIWFHTHLSRVAKLNQIRSEAEAEKSRNASLQVARERHMNEFLSHEVRNPLASAMSALSFVSATVNDSSQCKVEETSTRETLTYDLRVMDASLQFINELLRNMLDINRSASKQMKLDFTVVDVLRDVLDPVATIVHLRGASTVRVEIECPEGLMVRGDRMRLKQIILNLSANASKFVDRGYIRLRAAVVDGSVELSVEDSGPGIPPEKRQRVFFKFQESLDSLNQGTGIGLAVCKNLSELMGADLWLDESFESGIDGQLGTRFVVRLNRPDLSGEGGCFEGLASDTRDEEKANLIENGDVPVKACAMNEEQLNQLPQTLSVLFTDDDTVIRKMFCRSLKRVAPGWVIHECSNGECALRMTETTKFDLIFVDQYMASIEKQLLGTETVRAMRSRGVDSIICGLSANDVEQQFSDAGANAFMFKPFPCEKEVLTREILRILGSK